MRGYDSKLFVNADLSQPTLTSTAMDLDSMYGFSIQATFTGTAIGTLSIQGSNDVYSDILSGSIQNWTTLVNQPLTAPGTLMFNVDAAFYKWVRLVYTSTSGVGSITANFHAKGV